jgi:capsid protein
MTIADIAHSLLTGGWRLEREAAKDRAVFLAATRDVREKLITSGVSRMQLYAAANPGTKRPSPAPLTTPEDYKQAYERIVLIRGARQMEEDLAFADGLLDDFETYVVGDRLIYQPNTGNPEANKVIRDYLEWQFDQCDYSERIDLTKIAQLAVRSMKRDGECGFTPVDVGDAIKLRYTSGDCIGNPTMAAGSGANDWGGIITDPDTGAPVEFRLYKRVQKTNAYVFERAVPADHFWHYYDPFRFQQYHGVSIFKNALPDYYDIQQIIEFSKLNIKWRASQLPTVHTETGRPRGAGIGYFGFGNIGVGAGGAGNPPVNAQGVPMPMQTNVDGVTTSYLKLDEAVMEYPNDFPNAQLLVLLQELNRRCAKGAKLPVEFVYQTDNGGVCQRFWANKALQTFNKDKHLMRSMWLDPYKNRVIEKGIETGELDLSRFGDLDVSPERFCGRWQMGRAISVDYGKETDADIKLIEAGLLSPQDKVAEDGGDLTETLQEIEAHATALFEAAGRVSQKTGQPLSIVMPYLEKKFPNQIVDPQQDPNADEKNAIEMLRERIDAYGVGVRAGAITPTEEDENMVRSRLGFPGPTPAVKKTWKKEPTRRPITLTAPDGGRAAPQPSAPPASE